MNKIRRRLASYWPLIKSGLLVLLAILLVFSTARLLPAAFQLLQSLHQMTKKSELRQTQGRVNVLLLGVGGSDHIGFDLTDSLIFSSTDLESGETLLVSIPRDIWIDSMKAKINTAYHYGEEKKPGGGLTLAKAVVSEVVGQPVHYAVLLDFSGFVQAVDLVGGLEIEVERALDDFKYPVPGKEDAEPEESRYEHLHFEAGLQQMAGDLALKYVRSRYAEGEEGTDFARSRRQQKALLAFKDKVFSSQTFLNPRKIKELINIFGDSIKTDIQENEHSGFLGLVLKIKESKIETVSLDGELLYTPTKSQYEGQWVLIPRAGNWDAVHQYVEGLIW